MFAHDTSMFSINSTIFFQYLLHVPLLKVLASETAILLSKCSNERERRDMLAYYWQERQAESKTLKKVTVATEVTSRSGEHWGESSRQQVTLRQTVFVLCGWRLYDERLVMGTWLKAALSVSIEELQRILIWEKRKGEETKRYHMLENTPLINPVTNPSHNNTPISKELEGWSNRVSPWWL